MDNLKAAYITTYIVLKLFIKKRPGFCQVFFEPPHSSLFCIIIRVKSKPLDPKEKTVYIPSEHEYGLLPPPIHVGKHMREKVIDFQLPYDLWWLYRHKMVKTNKADSKVEQRRALNTHSKASNLVVSTKASKLMARSKVSKVTATSKVAKARPKASKVVKASKLVARSSKHKKVRPFHCILCAWKLTRGKDILEVQR